MKRLLLMLMTLAFVLPVAWAGEKTIVINRNEGIYEDGTGVYYCTKGGITMTFSSGLNNVNYLVEHQQVVFDIFSTNYVIKKIKFNCLDNTTDDNLDCFYWGPSTISEFTGAPYVPTGTYTWSGYIGTWVGGSTPSKYVKFVTEAKPVRFGSVEITYDKEFGDIYDLVRYNNEIQNGQTYALVSKYDSRALGKEEFHGDDPVMTFSSTPVTLLNFDSTLNNYLKVKVTDEVSLMKLESSGNSSRPWYIKIGDNYLRRRTGTMQGSGGAANGQGWNVYTVSNIPSGSESYFRTSITVENNNNNALIRYYHTSSETSNNETFAIRHYNGGDLFRVIDYNTANNQYANNQRVYLYKPAQTYYVTTNCLPNDDSGYITLGEGVLNDGNGNYTSQQYDNVSFFVGPTDGWGIGAVTVTNLSTNEVTTLTPTATNDFGNDYEFQMPAANVNVTANFLSPIEIDTICNPANGGQFNFINGYTNFNGQYYSNEGKTVTFKPSAAEGYIFQSVTYTDNVTGETTTMTPDANGVYSFVMPDHEVTLTANFEEAHDLYLLGTANGRTGWVPYGPKFIFDTANEEYYIDVYFKGGNDDQNTDPAFGYFSLTKKISDPEHPNWDELNGYRLAAETNNYWVEDGDTGIDLYGDRNNNAFKIKPGVYRIKVNKDMDEMSIVEYPLSLTFDPVSGSIVDPGQVVTITSNLDELVHAINPNEVNSIFYNTTDDWASQENDNTAVITQEGITTVKANTNLGYILVEGQADYEIVGDLYLLGTANGVTGWYPYGPQFTFDEANEVYYIDVYFKGGNDDPNAAQNYGYFSLTTRIADNWDAIANYRLYASQDDEMVGDGSQNVSLYSDRPSNAFMIEPGVYRITVNKDKTEMSITEYPLSLTFDPVSGSTVAVGDNVTITSNLDELVHNINANEDNATFRNSTDGGTTWDPDNTAAITEAGTTTTVTAEANIGYIVVPGNADYIVPAPTVYSITTLVTPEGSGAGTITAPTGSVAGETVTFTVTDADASVYSLTEVEVYNSLDQLITVVDNGNGSYSFTMPDDNVTIHAAYEKRTYNLQTWWQPFDGGCIWLNGVNTLQTIQVANGTNVVFGVEAAPGFRISEVVLLNEATQQESTPTFLGNNEYSFTMPTHNVVAIAMFEEAPYNITTQVLPDGAGVISLLGDAADNMALANETVNFRVSPSEGYALSSVTVTGIDGQNTQPIQVTQNADGTYSFTMPGSDVKITATFANLYHVNTVVVPDGAAQCNVYSVDSPSANLFVENTPMTVEVTPFAGYAVERITLTNLTTGTVTELTLGTDVNFVMPNSNVTVTVYLNGTNVICKQVTRTEEIVEGKTYTFINQGDDKVLNRIAPDAIDNRYSSTDIIEWVTPDKSVVKVGPDACFFIPEDLTLGEDGPSASGLKNPREAYLKTLGGYLGFEPIEDEAPFVNYGYLVLCPSKDDVQKHSMSIDPSGEEGEDLVDVYDRYNLNINSGLSNYYAGLVIDLYSRDFRIQRFGAQEYAPPYLYKVCEPFNITTVVVPDNNGDTHGSIAIEQTEGVLGTTALEGITVTVTPTADNGYALASLVVTVDETGEIIPVTVNAGGSRSFEMPSGDVTVTATFDTGFHIYADCDPVGSGQFTIVPMACAGDEVMFDVAPNDGYALSYVEIHDAQGNDVDFYDEEGMGYGPFIFTMPSQDVYIVAHFIDAYSVDYVFDPVNSGFVDFLEPPIPYFPEGEIVYTGVTISTGYEIESVIMTNKETGEVVDELEFDSEGNIEEFEMPPYDIVVTIHCILNSPLSFIEYPGTYKNGDTVTVTDTLIGTWVAKQYLWAKDQAPYVSNFYLEKAADENLHDFLREYYRLQYRDWDQSNWVMLDFSTIPELAGYTQQQLMDVMNDYVDNQIVAGSIKGTYKCEESISDPFGIYRGPVKIRHIIELSELPHYVKEPATIGPNNTLGYPGFQNDPQEKDGMYYAQPKSNYAYNHYTPANFLLENTSSQGIGRIEYNVYGEAIRDYQAFFMRPKDREVVQVWAVWLGEMTAYHDVIADEDRPAGDEVFEVYQCDPAAGINTLNITGAFRVGSWDYNINETDGAGKPIGYGKPLTPLRKDCDYTFHAAVEYSPCQNRPPRAPRRVVNGEATAENPEFYNVYPLDMTSPEETYTGVKEVVSRDATTIVDIRYYNIMGQESMTPFDGINIMVIRYKDGSFISKKILK